MNGFVIAKGLVLNFKMIDVSKSFNFFWDILSVRSVFLLERNLQQFSFPIAYNQFVLHLQHASRDESHLEVMQKKFYSMPTENAHLVRYSKI